MTLEEISQANREAGYHWFEPQALEFFNCKVLPYVFEGPGGIYFVSSEQYDHTTKRGHTVRQFLPATGQVATVGDFNELSKTRALNIAERLAAPDGGASKTEAPFKPFSYRQQFTFTVKRHLKGATVEACTRLIKLARRYDRLQVMQCGDGSPFQEQNCELAQRQEPKVEKLITALCHSIGCEPIFSGDPRGCCLKLKLPDGYTDDFAKEGLCVPIGKGE